MEGRIFSINISAEKNATKTMVVSGRLREGQGLDGDAHAGPGLRQISLLAIEQIEDFETRKGIEDLPPGSFGENITTEGFDLSSLRVGDKIRIGATALLRITQKGKDCHGSCVIRQKTGDCLMPKAGVFAVVETGGDIQVRDPLWLVNSRTQIFSLISRMFAAKQPQKKYLFRDGVIPFTEKDPHD